MHELFFDGAARSNPGPASYGYVVKDVGGRTVAEGADYIGETTNNVAEYMGLIYGLKAALKIGVSELAVYGDSLLVINQMKGVYGVGAPHLVPLWEEARRLASRFERIVFQHIPREQNAEADTLAARVLAQRLGPAEPVAPATAKQKAYIRVLLGRVSPERATVALKRLGIRVGSVDALDRTTASKLIRALKASR